MNVTEKSTIRCLTVNDLQAIVEVHKAAYEKRLMTEFGSQIISLYYRSHMEGKHAAVVLGIECESVLVGFCVMVKYTDLKPFFTKNAAAIAGAVFRKPSLLLRPDLLMRIRSSIRSLLGVAAGAKEELGTVRILSIAVHPSFQQLGYGQRLLQAAADHAWANGAKKLALTVRPENTSALKAYERDGWTRVSDNKKWSGGLERTISL